MRAVEVDFEERHLRKEKCEELGGCESSDLFGKSEEAGWLSWLERL
jgi:hypothetical protein